VAGPRQQRLQQRRLARRELQHLVAPVDGAALAVPAQPPSRNSGGRRTAAAGAAPPVQGAQPGLEFVEVEGLGQVVVGAGVQADDAVADRAARGEDQHRRGQAAPARLLQHQQAVHAGQGEVEHHHVGRRAFQRASAGGRRRTARRPCRGSQRALERRLHRGVVFDQQQLSWRT
jgi:hypothetical protein